MARHVFRGKVHIGYLAAIVAASNAGGSGSVVGDTTTTMMWIDGVSPLSVLEAFVAASVAIVIFGIPAAVQQHRYSPIVKDAPRGLQVDWTRVFIVAADSGHRDPRERHRQPEIPSAARCHAGDRARGLGGHSCDRAAAPARLGGDAGDLQGHDLPARARHLRVDDAGRAIAAGVMADRAGSRLRVGGVRQHSAHRARFEAGRLRLGLPRLCGRFRRLDDLVRLVGGRRAVEHVSRRRGRSGCGCAMAGTLRWPTSSASS